MNSLRNIDWITLVLYLILVMAGWLTINAASYNYDGASIFEFARPSGRQFVWFMLALFLIVVILFIDIKSYIPYIPFIYAGLIIILIITRFIAPETKGSLSWLKFGSVSIQPCEFGKFITALMLGWLFKREGFKLTEPLNFLKACVIVLLPVAIIIWQNETGSALVYFSLILLFYREGLSGIVLWAGFCFILIFVLGIKYSVEPLPPGVILSPDQMAPPSLFGQNLVLTIIPFLVACMLAFFADNGKAAGIVILVATAVLGISAMVIHYFTLPFEFEFRWVGWAVNAFTVLYCLYLYLLEKVRNFVIVALFGALFVGFLYTADFAFTHLQSHQRRRIEVLLGMKEDPKGAGYNVNQAKIAIGSGSLTGKGYLQGTQTKLAYVPEQETDFIFCTVGEEEGFVGSCGVLLLYLALILRLIYLAERQRRNIISHVYGYCVASIFAFHVIINVGMVIGLVPVIGIPLPFFSYGGSGLWSFTILLFIFLKLDTCRYERL